MTDLDRTKNYVVENRPDFGKKQIKSKNELKVGMKVILHKGGRHLEKGIVTRILEEMFYLSSKYEEFYCDNGLESYDTGFWNKTNWVEAVK